jgi:hypothetical protein
VFGVSRVLSRRYAVKKASLAPAAVLLSLSVLLLAGCGDGGASGPSTSSEVPDSIVTSSSEAASSDGGQPASSTDTTAAAAGEGADSDVSDQVFAPHDLLSADEAASFVGQPVALEDGSLYKDEESGVISERYRYDLGGTTIHALIEIHQDGYKKSDGSVKDQFLFEKELSKGEIMALAGLGDDAFTHGQGQLHLLYGSYYMVVAFDADAYETAGNAALNVKIGTKMLENLKAQLG